ncbi:hypothetical protein EYF80_001787 [Liparis tanakae]|uniref:Uncharacterized protein n=1 Tax=Liparis tanakae TaxID=230148 RepID=A0A4Z2JDJ3_9TELE|nr:hypothetical protein EYF80_001787 [Liparis tanakae]
MVPSASRVGSPEWKPPEQRELLKAAETRTTRQMWQRWSSTKPTDEPAASAPVSMLNRRSSCCRSCSALLSSRCSLRSSACSSLSSRASSRERRRSSADCCHFRKLAKALSRLF